MKLQLQTGASLRQTFGEDDKSSPLNVNWSRFLRSPFIRVPFFLLFGFNKRTLKQKGQKGTSQEPSGINAGSKPL